MKTKTLIAAQVTRNWMRPYELNKETVLLSHDRRWFSVFLVIPEVAAMDAHKPTLVCACKFF